MLSSRRVRALTASLLLAVATFVVVVPSAALWEPPTASTSASVLQASAPESATSLPQVARGEASVSASAALPQRAELAIWWLALLVVIAALVPIGALCAGVVTSRAVQPRDAVVGWGRGTRAPPRLLL